MPEQTPIHATYQYEGISEMARSLARTLQAAPAQESRRAAALRQYLIRIAAALAQTSDLCSCKEDTPPAQHYESCYSLVEQIRKMAAELATAPPVIPPGIGVVLQAFTERLLPDTLLLLRPSHASRYGGVEYLEQLHTLIKELGLDSGPEPDDMPKRFLALSYPQGEQDNVLLSCTLVRYLIPQLPETVIFASGSYFAIWALGPAHFFALALEKEATRPPVPDGHESPTDMILFSVSKNLKAAGWFDHPQIGPILAAWCERLGLNRGKTIAEPNAQSWARASDRWHLLCPGLRGYTPEDFDRDVPRLWERLRQLLPPNDLDINAVESAQPADEVSILNAGWSFYLLHMDDLYHILGSKTAEDRYEAKQVLNRLLTKGIELAQIARRWKEAREESGS